MVRSIKSIAKGAVVRVVAGAAPLAWRWRKAGSLVILTYHRVLPVNSPASLTEQPGMYVSPETLDLHLTEIKRYFELVDLADWLRRSRRGEPLPRLACAVTFDDGWRDNHDYALPLLVKHGAPATVFLVSEYIGTVYRFWPNRLMHLLRTAFDHPAAVTFPSPLLTIVEPLLSAARARGALRAEDADLAVQRAKALDEATIRGLIDATAVVNEQSSGVRDILDREEIGRMAGTGLVRFGSHTATHFRLAGEISPADLEREIVVSRRTLQALTGQAIELFCYPNGETSATAIDCVRRHYLGAVTTRAGWVAASPDPYFLERINLTDCATCTREGLLATISGWI